MDTDIQQPKADVTIQQPKADANLKQPKVDTNLQQPKVDVNLQRRKVNMNIQLPKDSTHGLHWADTTLGKFPQSGQVTGGRNRRISPPEPRSRSHREEKQWLQHLRGLPSTMSCCAVHSRTPSWPRMTATGGTGMLETDLH